MPSGKISEPEARAAYLAMGGDRSLAALYRKYSGSVPKPPALVTLKSWSKKFGWQALVEEHDQRVTSRVVARTETKQVAEIADAALELGIDRSYVLRSLKSVADRCMQAEPVTDSEGAPTGEFKFDSRGATGALSLLGKELGMFKDAAPAAPVNVNVQVNLEQARAEIGALIDQYDPLHDAARRSN